MVGLWIAMLLPLVAAAGNSSVAGTWNLSTNVAGNTGTPVCTLKQDEKKITGSCAAPNGGQSDVSGEVTDANFVFRYNIEWEGNPLTLVFTGTLDTDTSMKGTIEVQPMGVPGEFTGTRAK